MFLSTFASNRNSPVKYESVSTTSSEVDGNALKNRVHSVYPGYLSVIFVLFSVFQVALILYALSLLRVISPQPADTSTVPELTRYVSNCSCGATIQEAKAVKCAFDVLSLSWLPPACRDDELTHEFSTSGPGPNGEWDYWSDANRTSPLTLNEVASLAGRSDGLVYTTLGFHIQHCSFYWRKYWRVVKGVGALVMEARYDQESHVQHCQHVFMSGGSRDTGTTEGMTHAIYQVVAVIKYSLDPNKLKQLTYDLEQLEVKGGIEEEVDNDKVLRFEGRRRSSMTPKK